MDSSSKWLEQWDRVKRWYQRFAEIDEGKEYDRPSDYYQDDVLAFFLNCYHLKDWIKNDESVGAVANEVESFVKKNADLLLCADICNSIKHLKLEYPRSYQDPKFGRRNYSMQVGAPETTISVKYSIDTLSGPVDAFELAAKFLEAWKQFIQENINDKATV